MLKTEKFFLRLFRDHWQNDPHSHGSVKTKIPLFCCQAFYYYYYYYCQSHGWH